jgi:hypothetical protein
LSNGSLNTAQAVTIPLQPRPQQFTVSLLGVTYGFLTRWCNPGRCWTLDVSDVAGNPLAQGLALVTGTDILGQVGYLGIGGSLFMLPAQVPPDASPSFSDLGTIWQLVYIPFA